MNGKASRTMEEAIDRLADAIDRGLNPGKAEAMASPGALEFLGMEVRDRGGEIASGLRAIADAIDKLAEAVDRRPR